MGYRTLKSIFHELGEQATQEEERNRRCSTAAVTWDYRIGDFPMFCMLTPDIVTTLELIMRTDAQAAKIWSGLPSLVQRRFLRGAVIEEIQATNDIENVRSTRQEIERAVDSMGSPRGGHQRFGLLAQLYVQLLEDDQAPRRTLDEIRHAYNEVTRGEIQREHQPDGFRFRAQEVHVSTGQKVIHRGAFPESAIDHGLEMMCAQLNDEGIPFLVRVAAAHFIFEHVHPFYDGNGRTGRYLLAQELSSRLSPGAWFGLSAVIESHKGRYYKAFSQVEHVLNRGDITPFVATLLDFICAAQEDALERLEEVRVLLAAVEPTLSELGRDAQREWTRREKAIMVAVAQAEIGSHPVDDPGLNTGDMAELLGVSKQVVRRDAGVLAEEGWLRLVSRRPVAFALSEEVRRNLWP